ncbi:two-component sensor histidine kinase [Sphingomonas metalli]|uniref:histidine kinase n=1 Tax=Sphingomonas metalli TaxID=1779358 RepID=A0A916T3U5_9SPHN|nr:ATP-binding protein [Sphingomonas metalli]GGB29411.1 two-component sensor histidine kinase [Sphingomonas metalli]
MGDSRTLRRAGWVIAALVASLAAALIAGLVAERGARLRFAATLSADVRLRQALLASEVARFRLLPEAIADDRDLVATLAGQQTAAHALDRKLETLAAHTGAAAIYLVGPAGRALAASNWRRPTSFVGQDYRFRRYYSAAMRDGSAEQFALGTVSRRPGLYLSRRTAGGGVVVVKLEFDRIEQAWRAAGGITFVTARAGIVLVTSRPDWRFAATRPLTGAEAAAARTDYGVAALGAPPLTVRPDGLVETAGAAGPLLVARSPIDERGWQVALAMPVRGVVDVATRNAAIAAGLATLALAALVWGWRERARRRTERTEALEAAVAERTADLSREIAERAAAEARAAELREGLRQANRLAALGQITASVAHETAQPVAAIRNYAVTGEQLLDRGALEEVRGNLRAIDRLTGRIGAVTAELRGFSRKGSGAIGPVPLAEVIDGARLILKERLARVALILPDIPADLIVIAGRVRLEQVMVNLLQNAIEALEGQADPRIVLTLATMPDTVALTVADNGPGIAPDIAAKLFTPFATSRPQGLGLGLTIAQDIMHDLGGALRLVPGGGGAVFVVEMRRG